MVLTKEDIDRLRTAAGGFYNFVLHDFGLEPQHMGKGWMEKLVGTQIDPDVYADLIKRTAERDAKRGKTPRIQGPIDRTGKSNLHTDPGYAYFIFGDRVSKTDFDAHEIIPDDTDLDREFIAIVG